MTTVFLSFTNIPDRARHGDYNAWHQLDHRPENLALDAVHAGERWVRCPACARAAAAPAVLLDGLHYLNAYWFAEPAERSVREWQALAERSLDQGRRPDLQWARRLLMGFFEQVQLDVSPRLPLAPAALPLRPNRGVYAVVEEVPDPRSAAAEARFRHEREWRLPRLLATPGVAGVAVLSSLSTTLDPAPEGAEASRTLLLSPGGPARAHPGAPRLPRRGPPRARGHTGRDRRRPDRPHALPRSPVRDRALALGLVRPGDLTPDAAVRRLPSKRLGKCPALSKMPNDAVIVAALRTPIGRAVKGSLAELRADDLAAHAVRAALDAVPEIVPSDVEDLMLGCGQPAAQQGFNMARVVAVLAGLPASPA